MSEDNKKNWYMSFTPSGGSNYFYEMFKKAEAQVEKETSLKFMGVDWAAGHGMIRGEVIFREGNVTHIRFKTVTID